MNKKTPLIALISLLLIAGAVFAYTSFNDEMKDDTTDQQESTEINLDPPTEEEQKSGDAAKAQIAEERESSSGDENTDATKKDASVIVTDAAQYDDIVEVRAFVSNHIESGTCNYLFTKDSNILEKSMPARPDASSTICPTLEVDRSEFPSSGNWELTVSYDSQSAEGSSETKNITIN